MKTFFRYFSISAYLTVVILNIFLVESFAQTSVTYRPPKGKVREQTRKAGGSRGCHIPLENTVTLLVPQDHTATTISPYPTFFWHLSQKPSRPLRFTLLEPGKKPILTKELNLEPGIVALKLPRNSKPLKTGITYRWTVTVVCNPNKPSRNLFATAWIERVPAPKEVKLSNSTICSLTYAKAGIWYDALACNYINLVQNQNNPGSSWQQFNTLLEEIDLAYSAQQIPQLNLYE